MRCNRLDELQKYLTQQICIFQEAEELFETISQALLSSVDRDCLSGWGGHVYVV